MSAARSRKQAPDGPRSDLGSGKIPKEIDLIAGATAFSVVKRARTVDRLDGIPLTQGQKHAALIYRQAVMHIEAGIGMGPLPYGRDLVASGGFTGDALWAQQRALSAADWYRQATNTIPRETGETGVVKRIVIDEWSLNQYDRWRRWTDGKAAIEFRDALGKLARVYRTA